MTELTRLSLTDALSGLENRAFSASELIDAHCEAVVRARPLNAFITETLETARAQARQADTRRANGTAGALEGVPIAHKDLFCTQGVRTTAASRMLENFVPPYDSTVSRKLCEAGAISLGKTNMDEFAMGSSNESSAYGAVISPWSGADIAHVDVPLVPGGSSGGSAAAVAARCVMAATATDTGGSVRQPAAFSGIVGMKPTWGLCSRWGIIAYASSFDQAGVLTRTVADAAHMLHAMAGHDPLDATSSTHPVPDFRAMIGQSVKGLRVGIPREYRVEGLSTEIARLWDEGAAMLREAGADVVDVSLPHTRYALAAYYILVPAEASSNLARYDGVRFGLRVPDQDLATMYAKTRRQGFGEEVRRRILVGTYVLSAGYYDAYYRRAQRLRRLIRDDFVQAFEHCDVILTPTTPSPAFALGANEGDPVKMYLNDIFTVTVNLAGLPALSVPVGLSGAGDGSSSSPASGGGLPLGLQIIGRAFDEETVLRAGAALERASAFKALPAFCA